MPLRNGDIIIFYGTNSVSNLQKTVIAFKAIGTGFAMPLVHGRHNTNAVHCAIVCDAPAQLIAHSTSDGLTRSKLIQMRNHYSSYAVYRLTGAPGVADDVTLVAKDWCRYSGNHQRWHNRKYSNRKSAGSVFGSSAYGKNARQRAQQYAASVERDMNNQVIGARFGGPVSSGRNGGEGTFKGFYCSMFTVACYQSVMNEAQRMMHMHLDAKYTSPMILEEYLMRSSDWQSAEDEEVRIVI